MWDRLYLWDRIHLWDRLSSRSNDRQESLSHTGVMSVALLCLWAVVLPAAAEQVSDSMRQRILEMERQRIELTKRIVPTCVSILDENQSAHGSGVVIDRTGVGLTNYHVVASLMRTRKGFGGLSDGELYPLEVLGVDLTGDVAMFRLTGRERFRYAELGDSDEVRVGDEVIAVGNPFSLAQDYVSTVTTGLVTGIHRYQGEGDTLVYTDCVQTDAAINPGNSGGPLFSSSGQVIGINGRISAQMHKYARGRYNVGLGYAISINQIKRFIPHLRAGMLGRHGTLHATVTDDLDNVVFDQLYEDGPAWNAGIRVGDRLLRFGDQDIGSANHFASLLGTYPERWPVPITFESHGRVSHKVVHLDSVEPPMKRPVTMAAAANRRALGETIEEVRSAVYQSPPPKRPWSWSWTSQRVLTDGTRTTFHVQDLPGGKVERVESDGDGDVIRRVVTDKRRVALVEGDQRFTADTVETLLYSALRALRMEVLGNEKSASHPGALHDGGTAQIEIDDSGRTVRTRLLEVISWPVSDDVTCRMGFELDSHLPARLEIHDVAADVIIEVDLDDYREAAGVVWPHRMRVYVPDTRAGKPPVAPMGFVETIQSLRIVKGRRHEGTEARRDEGTLVRESFLAPRSTKRRTDEPVSELGVSTSRGLQPARPLETSTPHPPAPAGGFDRAIEAVSARVVRLFGLKAGLSVGYNSAVMVSDDGLVVTVLSLVLDAARLRAVTPDGTIYGVDILGMDDDRQLALLRLTPLPRYGRRGNRVDGAPIEAGQFHYFQPGDSRTLRPGDWVVAGGNPFQVSQGDEPVSVTVGVFSTRTELDARRKTRDFPFHGEVLVIDAITSSPGSAGGALVNLDGEWMGLIGRIVLSNRTHTNLNYAVPVETVMQFVDSVLHPEAARAQASTRARSRPYHGIKLFELGYRKKLVYVDSVKRGSPALRAGVRRDDLIVSVGGRRVNDIQDFKKIMSTKKPGDSVELVMIRDEQLRNVVLELAEAE